MMHALRLDLRLLGVISLLAWGCGPSGAATTLGGDPPTENDAGPPNIVLVVTDELVPRASGAIEVLAGAGVQLPPMRAVPGDVATVRAALLTGIHPDALGLGDGTDGLSGIPPGGVRVFPEILRRAGYFTVRGGAPRHNLSVSSSENERELGQPGLLGAWDVAGNDVDWRREPAEPCTVAFGCGGYAPDRDAPFFAMFNIDPSSDVDHEVSSILAAVEEDGLVERTAVIVIGTHGGPVGVIARWPGQPEVVASLDAPVRVTDVAPTILTLAGVAVPSYMKGRVLLGPADAQVSRQSEWPLTSEPLLSPWPTDQAPTAATPDGYPTGGVFHVAPSVELACETEDATIIYATERVAPFYWRLYTGPFRMRFWTLRFQCGRLGYRDSDVVTYDFDIE